MRKKIFLSILTLILILFILTGCASINNEDTNNENSNKNETTTDNSYKTMSEQEKSVFNSNFDMYLGKNVKGVQVKSLIASIKSSNENSNIGKVQLVINGESSMDATKIKNSSTYSVSFEYDEKGLICKAIVDEN